MKKFLKIVLIFLIIIGLGWFFLIQYIKSESNTGVPQERLNNMVKLIKEAPPLPQDFVTEYVKLEDTLKFNKKLLYDFTHDDYKSCPCFQLTNRLIPISIYKPNKFHLKTRHIGLVLNLEEEVSQLECLNALIQRYDFLYGNKGLEAAAQFYFKKKVENLSKQEIRTFIVMLKNPALFNPINNPERLKKELEIIKKINF